MAFLNLFIFKLKFKAIMFVKFLFKVIGIGVTSHGNLVKLRAIASSRTYKDFEFITSVHTSDLNYMVNLLRVSTSQLRQDIFVLSETMFKKNGYFIEVGAADGINLSNTHLLETEFFWEGILVEPATIWEKKLQENRPNASIETLFAWKDSNSKIVFNETKIPELSTINLFSSKDSHKYSRLKGKHYEVQTISLKDLLIKHKAPKYIDYLSIDVEGSEYEILNAFDFNLYDIRIITVEHNYSAQREKIFTLLTSRGYKRKYENLSYWDDWYVKI